MAGPIFRAMLHGQPFSCVVDFLLLLSMVVSGVTMAGLSQRVGFWAAVAGRYLLQHLSSYAVWSWA